GEMLSLEFSTLIYILSKSLMSTCIQKKLPYQTFLIQLLVDPGYKILLNGIKSLELSKSMDLSKCKNKLLPYNNMGFMSSYCGTQPVNTVKVLIMHRNYLGMNI